MPYIGYVHTGIEKSCEDKSYWKVIPLVERMDYLAYYFNAMAFCMSVERLLDEPVPERAQYLRVIHCELNRIHSHLVWLGTTALDLGAISIFWYCFRERDKILDLFEYSSGQRMHTRYIQVGGVADDIPAGWAEKALRFTEDMEERVGQYEAILDRNEIFLQRTKDVGIVSQERLLDARRDRAAAARRGQPVGPAQGRPRTPRTTSSTSRSRWARWATATTATACASPRSASPARSCGRRSRDCRRARYITTNRKVALPPRHELATSMEALIHHFKLVTEGFRVPPGEAYVPIESPRGELGCFVLADGSAKPARVHMRDPSFVNLQALREMVVGGYIADMITNLAMLDPILGGSEFAVRSSQFAGGLGVSKFDHLRGVPGSRSRLAAQVWEGARVEADPALVPEPSDVPVPEQLRATIEHHMSLYPDRRSAVLPALSAAQRVHGWLSPEAMLQVAAVMQFSPAYLESVASFYDMLELEPVGSHTIYMCTNLSCQMRGAQDVLAALSEATGSPGRRVERRRRVPPARVRVPRRVRHRADGVDRGPLPGAADVPRRADDRGAPARAATAARRTCCPEKMPTAGKPAVGLDEGRAQ